MKLFSLPVFQNALIVWLLWLFGMELIEGWELFDKCYFMTLTMIFGAFIAGSTSEGGGAVAFPVMTIFAGVHPYVARDFSLMIQSVGMSAAALVIVRQAVKVEWHAVRYGILGAIPGIAIGSEFVAPILSPPVTKLFFVSLWMVFAAAVLFRFNQTEEKNTEQTIISFSKKDASYLLFVGFLGGVVTSIFGSGLDIFIFMFLVFFYNVNEKVATPTSVVLMAMISLVGLLWRTLPFTPSISEEAWNYWWVSVPVVVLFAPLGAIFIRKRSRLFIVHLLFVSVLSQFVGAQLLIPQAKHYFGVTILTFAGGMGIVWLLKQSRVLREKRLGYKTEEL